MSALAFSLHTTSSSPSLPSTSLNLLPFHLEHNGPAPVSTYFLPRQPSSTVGSTTRSTLNETDTASAESSKRFPPGLVASFRGRRVQAHTVPLPAGYTGLVLSAPPIPTAKTEDVPQRQLTSTTLRKSQVTTVIEDEGVAGSRRSPRKRKLDAADEIKPTKRLQRAVRKVFPVQRFSLDSDSEDEGDDTLMATTEATTKEVMKETIIEEPRAASVLQGTSLESVETIVETEAINTASTTTPSELPSLSAIPPGSPTPPPSTIAQSPVPISEDDPSLSHNTHPLRKLDAVATFSAFTLWTPDGPMEGDGARDEYVRTLGEWVGLSREIHGC